MKIRKLFFAFLFCNLFFSYAYSLNSAGRDIRIGVILDAASFTAANVSGFYITDSAGKKLKLTKGKVILSYDGKNLTAGGKYALSLPVKIYGDNNIIFADKKAYRGYITVSKSGGKINVINILPIEDYIKGVLPKEVSASWNIEALKAQAVISRTYTLANLNKHSSKGFDLCATTHCQVYGGAQDEALSCNTAAAHTRAAVLTYGGKLAQTVFHANCAGRTEDPKYVWGWKDSPQYLSSVKCKYCADTPHSRWEVSLAGDFIAKKLEAAGYKTGVIKSIKIKGKTKAGSAKEIEIKGAKGTVVMNAYKFRLSVDAWKIKSVTFANIKKRNGQFIFKGKGWGHKVGLCQWGAKGMGDAGKNYKQILEYYYPKTKLEKIEYK